MIIYLLKTVLCSGVLLAVYYLLLQKEKMLHFIRFYLLFSMLFSFIVPLISFSVPIKNLSQPSVITSLPNADVLINIAPENTSVTTASPLKTSDFNWWYLVASIYTAGCLFMLFRFSKNILQIWAEPQKTNVHNYSNARLVLLSKPTVPHSFFHFIFLGKEAYENGLIQQEVLCHELAHVQQKHSFDIVLIELLLAFYWFNPILYVYRHAIRLNHEFLADEAVIKSFDDTPAYQLLLLQSDAFPKSYLPTSSLNFSITKKRFLMMKKNTSVLVAAAKGIAVFFLSAIALFVFSTRTLAQVKDTTKPKYFSYRQAEASAEDATEDVVKEFQTIVSKYHLDTVKQWRHFRLSMTPADRKQLEVLYKKMSTEQQRQQVIGFMPQIKASLKIVPTTAQFEGFKNPKVYGVWVDDKKIANSALNRFKASDFSTFSVSKLYGPAKAGRIYSYQVNMMTNDYYQKYYNQKMAKKDQSLMYALWFSKNKKVENRYVISSQ